MATLRPLLTRIDETDGLIDVVVYRLYGLTDAEIAMVEEAAGAEPAWGSVVLDPPITWPPFPAPAGACTGWPAGGDYSSG